jgi:triacylglycerol lipase
MIRKLGMDRHVAALLTVTTPHRGSPYADWCVRNLCERLYGFQLFNLLGLDVQAGNDLTTGHCARFNDEVTDSPDVAYFSVSASRPWQRVPAFMLHAWRVVSNAEGDNDCLVSVKSSPWGAHLGTWPADHFHTINRRLGLELTEPTGDITPYYLRALDEVQTTLGLTPPAPELAAVPAAAS